EVEMLRATQRLPDVATAVIPNGAGESFFDLEAPVEATPPVATFVGPTVNMSNLDGAAWMIDEVYPRVVARVPEAKFRLVGKGWEELYPLGSRPWLETRGYVVDLAQEVGRARVMLAPLRSGGGTKLKVVEAMAAARPVVATSVGAEGIPPSPGVAVEDTAEGFADRLVEW